MQLAIIFVLLPLFVAQAWAQELRTTPVARLSFDFGRWPYPLNEEVGTEMERLAEQYPDIARVHRIGKTRQGRDLWVMEITNRKTGDGITKPGLWMDGNIHAGEISGRPYLRYFINRLLTSYGKDEKATRLVDTRTFYVMPILDADGGDWWLSRHPVWPGYKAENYAGEDLDGDGYITSIRVKDSTQPKGYRYYMESREVDPENFQTREEFVQYAVPLGTPFMNRRRRNQLTGEREGADFNRNWSADWKPQEPGAGPRPFSLPEVAAVADFIIEHQNIYFTYSIHSGGGGRSYIVRPPMDHPYEWMPPEDNDFYVRIGATWGDLSKGGIMENNYYSFLFNTSVVDPKTGKQRGYSQTYAGFADDWAYMHQGIHSLTPEINGAAPDYNNDGWILPAEEERWHQEEKGGQYASPWKSYDHPVLGKVEIGGSRGLPQALDETLKEHCEIQYDYLLHIADWSPLLRIHDVTAEAVKGGRYRVVAKVVNEGWLSTYVTQHAIRINRDLPAVAEITVEGAKIEGGNARRQVGHVRGKLAYIRNVDEGFEKSTETVEWMVKPGGSGDLQITVKAWAPKAGRDEKSITVNR